MVKLMIPAMGILFIMIKSLYIACIEKENAVYLRDSKNSILQFIYKHSRIRILDELKNVYAVITFTILVAVETIILRANIAILVISWVASYIVARIIILTAQNSYLKNMSYLMFDAEIKHVHSKVEYAYVEENAIILVLQESSNKYYYYPEDETEVIKVGIEVSIVYRDTYFENEKIIISINITNQKVGASGENKRQ